MTQHGISAARLEARGLGERALLDAGNPDAAINRRVEIVNLGAASN
jgi:flagellar motor protein MotB